MNTERKEAKKLVENSTNCNQETSDVKNEKGENLSKTPSDKPMELLVTLLINEPLAEEIAMTSEGTLAIGCDDGTLKIWDISQGKKIKEYKLPENLLCWFDKNPNLFVCTNENESELTLYDIKQDQSLCTISNVPKIEKTIVSESGKTLACSSENFVLIYDLTNSESNPQQIEAGDKICSLILHSDSVLLLGLNNGNIEKWIKKENNFIWQGALWGMGNKNTPVTELIPVLNMFACYKQSINLLQLFDLHLKCTAEIETKDFLCYFNVTGNGTLVAATEFEFGSHEKPKVYFFSLPDLQESSISLEQEIESLTVTPEGEVLAICGNNIFLIDSLELRQRKKMDPLKEEVAKNILLQVMGVDSLVNLTLDYSGFFSRRKPIICGDVGEQLARVIKDKTPVL